MMESSEKEETLAQIYDALHYVDDPELAVNIVDLGLIYDITIDDEGYVTIAMTLTTPGCPMHESLGAGVGYALEGIPGVTGGEIRLVWDPPWEPSRMTEDGRKMLGFF